MVPRLPRQRRLLMPSSSLCVSQHVHQISVRCRLHLHTSPPRSTSKLSPTTEHPRTIGSTHPGATPPHLPSLSPTPSRLYRYRRYIFIFCFAIGLTLGNIANMLVIPISPDQWDEKSDVKFLARFRKTGNQLEIVKNLEADEEWQNLGELAAVNAVAEKPPRADSDDAERKEKEEEEEEEEEEEQRNGQLGNRYMTKTLSGVHTIGGFQRVFRHVVTGQLIVVVHIGCATWGWPYVAHGGLLASILDECMGICASGFGNKGEQRGMTEELSIKYLQKVGWSPFKNNFWVVRVNRIEDDDGDDAVKGGGGQGLGRDGKRRRCAEGTLESLDGVICVEAQGCYVEPRKAGERL